MAIAADGVRSQVFQDVGPQLLGLPPGFDLRGFGVTRRPRIALGWDRLGNVGREASERVSFALASTSKTRLGDQLWLPAARCVGPRQVPV